MLCEVKPWLGVVVMLDLSNRSENLCMYSCRVSEGFCCWPVSTDDTCCFVATEPAKIVA